MTETEFASVLQEYGGMLARIAAVYEARAAQRQELLQEIALALWRALPSWRDEAPLKAFIARIAHNRGATHAIAQKPDRQQEELSETLPSSHPDPEHSTAQEQQRERLLRAVRQLSLAQRRAVSLVLEGHSHVEIADLLGTTANNIDARLSRARQALKQALEILE